MGIVLCTGGAGYVGTVLVPTLLLEGYKVRVLDKFQHRDLGLMGYIRNSNLEVVKGDCRDVITVRECLKDVEWIIPLAAIVGAPACDNHNEAEVNSINSWSINTLVKLVNRDQKILYPNTNSGYGTTAPGEVCTEETLTNPISLYGRTKDDAEDMVLSYHNALSFRFATAFGASPRMRLDLLVNDFVYRAVKDGFVVLYESHFRRNYIHVIDMARAFIHGMRNFNLMKGEIFNVGLDYSLSKLNLCELISKIIPNFHYHEAEIGEDHDKRDYQVSVDKIRKTGFEPHISVEDGIRELVKAYKMMPPREFANA